MGVCGTCLGSLPPALCQRVTSRALRAIVAPCAPLSHLAHHCRTQCDRFKYENSIESQVNLKKRITSWRFLSDIHMLHRRLPAVLALTNPPSRLRRARIACRCLSNVGDLSSAEGHVSWMHNEWKLMQKTPISREGSSTGSLPPIRLVLFISVK